MSQLLLLPVQALQSWRGLHLSVLNVNFATASSSQDLSKPSSPAFPAPAWHLLTGFLLPGAHMLLAAPDSAVLWAGPNSPDEWKAKNLAPVTPEKNFPLQLLGSALGLALAPGNPDFL